MLLRGPVDTDEPPSFFVHHALPLISAMQALLIVHANTRATATPSGPCTGAQRRGLPTGHRSRPFRRGTYPEQVLSNENWGTRECRLLPANWLGSGRYSVRAVARGSTRRFATLHSVCYRATTFLEPRGKGTGRMALSFLELANWEIGLSGRERHQPRKCERLWTPPAQEVMKTTIINPDAVAWRDAPSRKVPNT